MNGQFEKVFQKIATLHAKNAFALAIIAGDLFADSPEQSEENTENIQKLVDGKIAIPLPTYFALGKYVLPIKVVKKLESSNGELCDNLYFLGKRTTMKTTEGFRIISLGGVLDSELTVAKSKDNYTPFYATGDANSLRGANKADILITSEWPSNIRTGSKAAFPSEEEQQPKSHQCIADLCVALNPRYHFSLSPNAFFEREPFFQAPKDGDAEGFAITRFISLAAFGNPSKQKWIYAFSLDPNASQPLQLPPGTSASPLSFSTQKRPLASQDGAFSRFSQNTQPREHRPTKRRRNQPPPGPGDCFFCLSSPNLAAHLITSIGTDAYLTIAKGPLSTAATFATSALPFPAHILIIPLPHAPTLAAIPDPSMRAATTREMTRYRISLHDMVTKVSAGALSSVTWEVSRAGGVHTHWQFLPVPSQLVTKGLVEAAFKVEAENEKYPGFESAQLDSSEAEEDRRDCFRVWIASVPEDGKESHVKRLLLPLDDSFRFDVQLGRRVMAKLLGLEDRSNWRDCAQTEAEETADADSFKAAFKTYDFTLDA